METVYILNHYQKLIKENFCVAKETTKKKTKQKKKKKTNQKAQKQIIQDQTYSL